MTNTTQDIVVIKIKKDPENETERQKTGTAIGTMVVVVEVIVNETTETEIGIVVGIGKESEIETEAKIGTVGATGDSVLFPIVFTCFCRNLMSLFFIHLFLCIFSKFLQLDYNCFWRLFFLKRKVYQANFNSVYCQYDFILNLSLTIYFIVSLYV